MTRERVVNVRVSEAGIVAFDAACKTRGVARSAALRDAMQAWMAGGRKTSDVGSAPSVAALNTADIAELRWWRQFADRTVVNGDPDRQVTPGIDLAGWTFYMAPEFDEHLKAIS